MEGSRDAMQPCQMQEVTNGGDASASIKCDVRKHFGFLASRLVEVESGRLPLNDEDTTALQPVRTDGTCYCILELSKHVCSKHMFCFSSICLHELLVLMELVETSIPTIDYTLKGM